MSYAVIRGEYQRTALLHFLDQTPGHALPEAVLIDAGVECLEAALLTASTDQVRAHVAWLVEAGLAEAAPGEAGRLRLTRRGRDVVRGRASHPGVRALPDSGTL